MPNVWVCKFDGTIQCDENSEEITLEQMRKQLALVIGEDNILNMRKSSRPMIDLCGVPTGRLNSYEITERGWFLLNRGFVGNLGFEKCSADGEMKTEDSTEVNIGKIIGECTKSNPIFVRELIAHSIRVYKTGDTLTRDWQPDRVNIETNMDRTIINIWFG
ncbi:MAG: hypothetical protein NTAFB09_21970 [Nitrosospira sp.]